MPEEITNSLHLEEVTVFGALLGAALGAALCDLLSHRFSRNRSQLEIKYDVLRRLIGFRWTLTPGRHNAEGHFFTALNEAHVVFAGDKDVDREIETFHRALEGGFRAEHLQPLAEAMARSDRVPNRTRKSEIFERLFAPH